MTVFNSILAVSIVALLVVHANSEAAFLSVVTFANMLVGIVNEFRAKWALDRLAVLQNNVVTMRRDGRDQRIPRKNSFGNNSPGNNPQDAGRPDENWRRNPQTERDC
ncbi:hypothetical protein [Paraburkholderia sp. UCT70]|uniref:hypothetical protein n=1 Tax=Paraburkholderia sp. UCT70 TaxID=2991068 RepID=UPI003D25F630